MRARLINEEVDKDSDIVKIQDYAKKHNLNFGVSKTGTPYISLDVYYGIMQNFDRYTNTSSRPALITKVIYTFTYPEDFGSSDSPISLRKVWYGHDDDLDIHNADAKLFVMQIEYLKKSMNEGIKYLAGRSPNELEKIAKQYVEELSDEEKKDLLRVRNLKQSLVGRFATIEEALEKVSMNYPKELKKSKK